MIKEILVKILEENGIADDKVHDLATESDINYITISKWENKFVASNDNIFRFDLDNNILEIYAVKRNVQGAILGEDGKIQYVTNKDGKVLFDLYPFEAIELVSRRIENDD